MSNAVPVIHLTDEGFRVEAPKPRTESGEKLSEERTRRQGDCYFCGRRSAAIYLITAIPQCGFCYERWRRRD